MAVNAAKVATGMRQAGIPVIHVKGSRRLIEIERKTKARITDASLAGFQGIGTGRATIFIDGTYGAEPARYAKDKSNEKVLIKHWIDGFIIQAWRSI